MEQSATAMPQGMWKEMVLWAALWGIIVEEQSATAMPQGMWKDKEMLWAALWEIIWGVSVVVRH